jgi:hypothetical protein
MPRAARDASEIRAVLTALSETPKEIARITRGCGERQLRRKPAADVFDWSRGATFTATTLGREATVLDYAKRIADHEARHLGQLQRTVER